MQEMNGASLQQFILKKMGRSWDDITNERATLDDIDRKAIEYFLRKGIEAQRISESELNSSTEEVLTNLGLIDDKGGIKNAAILLFGKNPLKFIPSVRFKIGRFGIDEADLMFQDIIEGNIIQMADRVLEVLQAKYLISPVRFEGMQRYESLEIPKEALREILYNAIAHKDYTGPDIQMHVYNNQIEIWNEGILPEGYDEDVLYGKHSSKPRNRNIADTMFKAGFIDTWGRGYKKIREGFEKAGMPMPKVKNFCGGVQITIERSKFVQVSATSDNEESNVTSVSPVELTERQKKICNMIKDNPRISVKEMSLVLSLADRTIKRDIATMQKMGILVREGNTSAGHWVIIHR
jgi:ATP-dependent DNA helicase RecG